MNVNPLATQIEIQTNIKGPDYSIVVRLLKKFHHSPLVFHFNNRSRNSELLHFILRERDTGTQYIWNYDMLTGHSIPCDQHYIHVIDINNSVEVKEYFSGFNNLCPNNIIVFLVRQKSVPKSVLTKLSKEASIFVVALTNRKIFFCNFSSCQFECILKEIKIYNVSHTSILKALMSSRDMVFRIGYLLNAPYVYRRRKDSLLYGSEIALMEVLSELYSFRYELIGFSHHKGNKYSSMLKHLVNGSICWAIGGINQNLHRTKNYDFLKYIRNEGMTAMFYRSEETRLLPTLLGCSNFQFITLSVLLCILGLFLMENVSTGYFGTAQNDRVRTLLGIVAPLMDQIYPLRMMFNKKSVKFVLLLWWLSCCLFSVIYKNYLFTSYLSSSQRSKSILDLITDEYRFVSFEGDYWYIRQSCGDSLECIGVKKRFSANNLCESSSMMVSEKLALIGQKHGLNFQVIRKCNKLSQTEKTKLEFVNDNILGVEMQSWVVRKNFIFTGLLSRIISHMEEAGILQKWVRKEFDPNHKKSISSRSTRTTYRPRSLDLKKFSVSFVILVGGFIISLLIFSIELLMKRR